MILKRKRVVKLQRCKKKNYETHHSWVKDKLVWTKHDAELENQKKIINDAIDKRKEILKEIFDDLSSWLSSPENKEFQQQVEDDNEHLKETRNAIGLKNYFVRMLEKGTESEKEKISEFIKKYRKDENGNIYTKDDKKGLEIMIKNYKKVKDLKDQNVAEKKIPDKAKRLTTAEKKQRKNQTSKE